jgi:hypothetical protein
MTRLDTSSESMAYGWKVIAGKNYLRGSRRLSESGRNTMPDPEAPKEEEQQTVVYRYVKPVPDCAHRWSEATTVLSPTAFGAYSRTFQRCLLCGGVRDA